MTAVRDPWLSARVHDRAQVAAAEAELAPAIRAAADAYLAEVRAALWLGGALTAAGGPGRWRPDWAAWPSENRWRQLVNRHVTPVWRRIWRGAYGRTAPDAPEGAGTGRADDDAASLAERLRGFPRRVWERARSAWREGEARGETAAQLRARVAALAVLDGWTGSVLTMTRTEVVCALNAGALGAALDEQSRTGRRWTKRWLATSDDRTRASHRAADGQAVPLAVPFTVGGSRFQFPGDPRGPAGEVINCRCSMQLRPE